MAYNSYSGRAPASVGAGQASDVQGLDALYGYSSPEALALGIRPYHDYWGSATVANGTTTIAVTFDEPRPDATYLVFVSFGEDSGLAATVWTASRTTDGFTITVDADPGADVDVFWRAVG